MARRRKFKSKKDSPYNPLVIVIAAAVGSAAEAAGEAGADIRRVINGRSGLGAVFTAAMDAVADTEPGNIDRNVFDAAMKAAAGAIPVSAISSGCDRVRRSVQSTPDHLVQMAARQAALDLFAKMLVQGKINGSESLRDSMKTAAVQAAKTRLEYDDAVTTVRAAAANTQEISDIALNKTSVMVMIGVPVLAATVAVFEVAVRGVPPDRLGKVIENTCRNLPDVACQYDDIIVAMVTALSMMILDDAAYRQKYQTAVQGVVKMAQDEAADRIVDEIVGNTFEAVYMALISGAYANSDGSVFKHHYDEALATVCGVNAGRSRRNMKDMRRSGGTPPGVNKKDFLDLQYGLADIVGGMSVFEMDTIQRKVFMNASGVDYKDAVSSGHLDGIITLYDMAYRAGYKGASTVVDEKAGGERTGPQ